MIADIFIGLYGLVLLSLSPLKKNKNVVFKSTSPQTFKRARFQSAFNFLLLRLMVHFSTTIWNPKPFTFTWHHILKDTISLFVVAFLTVGTQFFEFGVESALRVLCILWPAVSFSSYHE